MSRTEAMPPPDRLKRRLLLAIIAMALLSTVVSWWVMDVRRQASPALHGVHVTSMLMLFGLLLAAWRRWLPQRVVELVCLGFGVGACAACMALRMYWPQLGGDIDLQSLYLWIPVMYVLAFTMADSRASLRAALAIMALFTGVSLPFLLRDLDTPDGNLTVQLHMVSAALVAALYFFASYQRRLQLAQLTVDQLAQLSNTDELTGLPNRRRMAALLAAELAAPAGGFAVLLFDIDHFKAINDQGGHGQGDAVLRALAGRATGQFRGGDVLGRWGGDEFVALLRHIDAATALQRAESLCASIAGGALFGRQCVTISCGVAAARAGDDIDSLLQRADAALYAAKHAGRNRAAGVPVHAAAATASGAG